MTHAVSFAHESAVLWPALVLGLAGSLHCVGMCGPLALALPSFSKSRGRYMLGRALYNAGRIVTYSILGAIFGLFGETLALAGWQRGVSIAAGAFMLLAAFFAHRLTPTYSFAPLRNALRRLLGRRTNGALLAIGLLNGLLPCGLVYVALAGAAATNSSMRGAAFMAIFGLGTFPAMFAVSLAGRIFGPSARNKIQKLIPIALIVLGAILILRGLNLGIPYLSPHLSLESGCCSQ